MSRAVVLLQQIAQGEPEAVRDCIRRYGPLVWTMARRFCGPGAEAEDAVQEVFVDLWQSADRYDPSLGSEVVFVSMIARRRLIDRRRRMGRRPQAGELQEERTVPHLSAERIEACGEAALAQKLIAQLPDDQRRVLLLAAYGGLSHAEIAESTGMPLGTVKAHARRGLMRVRELLEGLGGTAQEVAP
jgi:RNA polymerase sigma-70 factor (ECF subfamily)